MDKNSITYRNGLPSKASIKWLITGFFAGQFQNSIRPSFYYGKITSNGLSSMITWESNVVQNSMLDFIDYLNTFGIEVKNYREYTAPMRGSMEIVPLSMKDRKFIRKEQQFKRYTNGNKQ